MAKKETQILYQKLHRAWLKSQWVIYCMLLGGAHAWGGGHVVLWWLEMLTLISGNNSFFLSRRQKSTEQAVCRRVLHKPSFPRRWWANQNSHGLRSGARSVFVKGVHADDMARSCSLQLTVYSLSLCWKIWDVSCTTIMAECSFRELYEFQVSHVRVHGICTVRCRGKVSKSLPVPLASWCCAVVFTGQAKTSTCTLWTIPEW